MTMTMTMMTYWVIKRDLNKHMWLSHAHAELRVCVGSGCGNGGSGQPLTSYNTEEDKVKWILRASRCKLLENGLLALTPYPLYLHTPMKLYHSAPYTRVHTWRIVPPTLHLIINALRVTHITLYNTQPFILHTATPLLLSYTLQFSFHTLHMIRCIFTPESCLPMDLHLSNYFNYQGYCHYHNTISLHKTHARYLLLKLTILSLAS